VLAVGNCCYVAVCSVAQGAHGGRRGAGHTVAAARLQVVINRLQILPFLVTDNKELKRLQCTVYCSLYSDKNNFKKCKVV